MKDNRIITQLTFFLFSYSLSYFLLYSSFSLLLFFYFLQVETVIISRSYQRRVEFVKNKNIFIHNFESPEIPNKKRGSIGS